MKKLMDRWGLKSPFQVVIILLVFSITGSTSLAVGRPLLRAAGVSLENLDGFIYYPLFVVVSFILYQVFLVSFGLLFGQHAFFWAMEKKMLKRFGVKI